ncbi:hypothetical protein [Paenibacillus hexagrammi]|uniref:Uncharacterized protein n=1 Tax=Paenibacillus hexagrammi TaxID=2908839 RepID=A0ABY3STQ4_9BACL|nr:hypothetical protein [Paenibacillus sp. YPD9-1]UJF36624.1 hypothetical protein L0M14_30510 [Paenibacillus sp. YPD9-1]
MSNLQKVTPGASQAPLASDLNQIIDTLNGSADMGSFVLAPPIAPPTTLPTATAKTDLDSGSEPTDIN